MKARYRDAPKKVTPPASDDEQSLSSDAESKLRKQSDSDDFSDDDLIPQNTSESALRAQFQSEVSDQRILIFALTIYLLRGVSGASSSQNMQQVHRVALQHPLNTAHRTAHQRFPGPWVMMTSRSQTHRWITLSVHFRLTLYIPASFSFACACNQVKV